MPRTTYNKIAAIATGLVLGASVMLPAAHADDYYAGQTIRMIIPFSPGGGTDTFGRLISQHLGRHIPGSPTIVSENVTGAGGLLGSNEFAERVDHDGLTLMTASGHLNLRAFLGLQGLRLDLDELEPVVAAPMGHVTAISTQAGIDDPADLLEAQGRLTKGITDPVGLLESLVALEMFELNYRAVPGYSGRGDTRIAFERGELMINTQSTPAYLNSVQPLVDEGVAMPLYAIGFIDGEGNPQRDPAVPDMITAPELYEQIHGEMPSGTIWEAFKVTVPLVQNTRGTVWVHGDIPDEAMAALQEGVEAMINDPEFQEASANILEGYEIMWGDDLGQIKASMDAASPEVLDYLRDMLNERFGTEFD
ncbi:Bug family tripartite tricarboxylate transporter substrate binding protein [Billgrantia kenyensis]|uniref:Tripartite-type tricarboxylate transporter, receptor component TctC n=1 Tax=Billgrantia kenyensis TaxID=321266 RepID=A0A7V9VY17_9GAMM|nr:hypothetical protein [Halomonas kenyensis]MBA2777538.1 hypothetical protein [Halomonas kenyensis]MCG6660208.1 hypothetical protein [Halomonas kenyensis]